MCQINNQEVVNDQVLTYFGPHSVAEWWSTSSKTTYKWLSAV